MKLLNILSLSCLFAASPALGQNAPLADWTLAVTVTTEDGTPIEGADARAGYPVDVDPNPPQGGFPVSKSAESHLLTDKDGKAVFKYQAIGESLSLLVSKEGYYDSEYLRGFQWTVKKDTKVMETSRAVILKPKGKPVPLLAAASLQILIPELDKEYGYDLEMMALTAPNGSGKHDDIRITVTGRAGTPDDAELHAKIVFPNKLDGILEFITQDREGPLLLSAHRAPEKGYVRQIARTYEGVPKITTIGRDDDPRRNFYFKVRTVVDPITKREISNYGKIYGDFALRANPLYMPQGGARIELETLFFNPRRDDMSVEFDPKQNLIPKRSVDPLPYGGFPN